MTTITDRAAFFADAKLGKTVFVVLHKDARELESMCEEQHQALRACAAVCAGETMSKSGLVSALELARKSFARYQAMKEKAK